jgi:hypothetical protein
MSYDFNPNYAEVLRYPAAIDLLRPPYLGVDFEWDIRTGNPTVIGVSDGQTTASVDFVSGWDNFRSLIDRFPDAWKFVGHNFIRAERPILDRFGVRVPLGSIEDTIIWHYLTSAHLCKAGGKALGEGVENERRGPGFMNIWTMCSIWTSEPNWKFCRGETECHGVPCPHHDPFWYNGLDARNPVLALPGMIRKAKLIGVDHLYPLHARLMEQFEIMQQRGVWVDLNYISKLKTDFEAGKSKLWEDGQKVPTDNSLPFNPESWQQVKRFFKEKYELIIEDTQEDTIRELAGEHLDIPELQDLLEYKEMGSGPDRWFAPKRWNEKSGDWEGYVVEQGGGLGTIHPNVNIFTSTSRTACSNPNLQNLEKRRIDRETGEKVGERLRAAVVAPPGYRLYSADQCLAPGTKVLTSDLLWASIEELRRGDKIIGFDENIGGYRPQFKVSRVISTRRLLKPSFKITTDRGEVISSENHWWPVRRYVHGAKGSYKRLMWVPTKDLLIGEKISYFLPPWEPDISYNGGWLAGFFNGEGSVAAGQQSLARVSFAQNKGPTLQEAFRRLRDAGYRFSSGKKKGKRSFSKKNRVVESWISGVGEGLRFVGSIRPSRLLKKAFKGLIGRRIWSGQRKPAQILKIEFIGEHPVIGLKTSTKTLVANGFLSHNSNGENRAFLYMSGYDIPRDVDLHDWMVSNMGIKKEDEFAIKLGGPRDASKSVTHAADYMEGLQLKTREQLRSARVRSEIQAGARVVSDDWQFRGSVVTFSGVNLAKRAFGEATYSNRKKALEAAERYIGRTGAFPMVRDLQKRITAQVEREGAVQVPEGYYLYSYDRTPEDQLKTAASMFGQSPVAHRLKLSLLNLEAHPRLVPILPVHDENLVLASEEYDPKEVKKWIQEAMEVETPEMPGLRIPVKVRHGKDWRSMTKIE